jgi:hypothetical protein
MLFTGSFKCGPTVEIKSFILLGCEIEKIANGQAGFAEVVI